MSQRRVVITGLGQVSPVGNTAAEAWDNLLAGKSGIGAITRFDASDINSRVAGEVRGFDIGQYISAKEARRMDVFITTASPPHCRRLPIRVWTMWKTSTKTASA